MAILQMSPLHKMHEELHNVSNCVGKTDFGISVVPGNLDFYMNVCMAPHHVLKDLIIDLFTPIFKKTPNIEN